MTDFADRLKLAMAGPPEVKPADLARACGIKQPSVSDWLNRRTKQINGANLLAAAEVLNVNPWWLASGAGPMRSAIPQREMNEIVALLQSMDEDVRRIAIAQIKALADLNSVRPNSAATENDANRDNVSSSTYSRNVSEQRQALKGALKDGVSRADKRHKSGGGQGGH
ncbi:helix-turn-helix domain-containing protein [Cupriavidus sp. BIC8F]|uniref:helix-turn-helix domain-containing protein n=1 Tax=Cupriavidus sp. BIC8F TaxID=3079014 RepID=UPI0029169A91|nr:helix-turn-helix domain-containing protein [Cupriavidus sp. BIC8F]